jgi:hypothetical protein
MSRFVARHFGAPGHAWLSRLPGLIERYAAEWDLLIEDGLEGGLLSCVMSARTAGGEAVVLKIGGPWTPIDREACALAHWAGGPAPSLLEFDRQLERVDEITSRWNVLTICAGGAQFKLECKPPSAKTFARTFAAAKAASPHRRRPSANPRR